jgi:HD superfamily phosphohydrolase YqeK
MEKKIFTAIIFKADKTAAKYRNITNVEKFKTFALNQFPGALYINLYYKQTKQFAKRIYLQDQQAAAWQQHLAR